MWVETRIVSIPGFGQGDVNPALIYRQNGRMIFFTAKGSKDSQRESEFYMLPVK
jgi:hypothetical protein